MNDNSKTFDYLPFCLVLLTANGDVPLLENLRFNLWTVHIEYAAILFLFTPISARGQTYG